MALPVQWMVVYADDNRRMIQKQVLYAPEYKENHVKIDSVGSVAAGEFPTFQLGKDKVQYLAACFLLPPV